MEISNKNFVNTDGIIETAINLKAKYNPEGSILRRSQLRMLEMLKWLDEICKSNGIEYFLASGNLLGAYRHEGFIPWDDDVDILIMRKDYKKLKKVLLSEKYINNENFILQCHETDKGFKSFYAVLRDKKSEYIQDSAVHRARKYRGLQIDIFPQERGILEPLRKFCYLFERVNIKWLIGRHKILSEVIYQIEDKFVIPICKFISSINPNKNWISYDYACFWNQKNLNKDIFPLSECIFEGFKFPAPKNIVQYLKNEYGECFMILPPPSSRANHHIMEIIFHDDFSRQN